MSTLSKKMATIGLLGGMSWESTALYYKRLNQLATKRLGGVHSAPLIVHSFDFDQVRQLQLQNNWEEAGKLLSDAAERMQQAGARCVAMAVNTMHIVAPAIRQQVQVPFIDIRDCLVRQLTQRGASKVLLLGGSIVTARDGFYVQYLQTQGIECVLPDNQMRQQLETIIFEEFPRGIFSDAALQTCLQMIEHHFQHSGVNYVALACTELPVLFANVLIGPEDDVVKMLTTNPATHIIDTVQGHVQALIDQATK